MNSPETLNVVHERFNKIGNAAKLQHYWTKDPEGLAKWADTPTPFRALVAELAKYVANPEGLAATYYHIVFREWPGDHGKPKSKSKGKRK